MGKSSSAKKKRSKYSSQGRTKTRNKTRKRRTRKLRGHDDSVSDSSDDSSSSFSVPSDSNSSYSIRRPRSRTRKNVKGGKRRARSCSSSSEEFHDVRKRKGSKRNYDSELRKKNLRGKKKKKARRDASISSRSSASQSSTCRGSRGSSDDSEYEYRRGRSERRKKNARRLENVKSGNKKKRYRSRSCSSCHRHDNSDYFIEGKVTGGNISKRLRSVITLAKEDKEEMIYDHNDYPSSRSNDSNDGGIKSVSAHQSHVVFEKERSVEIEKTEDANVFNTTTAKLPDSYKDGDDQLVTHTTACNGVGTTSNNAVEKKNNEISEADVNVNSSDLESLLRQKALENLRRFCEGFPRNASIDNQKDKSDGNLKFVSTAEVELSQIEYSKDDGAQGVKGKFSHPAHKDKKVLDINNGDDEYVPAKNSAHLRNQVTVSGKEKVNMNIGSGINKPRLVTSALKQALSNATTTVMEVPASQVSSKAKLDIGSRLSKHNATHLHNSYDVNNGDEMTNSEKTNNASSSASVKSSSFLTSGGGDVGLHKSEDEGKEGSQLEQKKVYSLQPVNSNHNGDTVNNASDSTSAEPSSGLTTAARDISLNKEQDDGKEGSQLEQKTMSVMRGGEMVQVSYKVYIPKKAPALARRQLKR